MGSLADLSVYIHVPFCTSKCHYCDFYSTTGAGPELLKKYTENALLQLDRNIRLLKPDSVETVFIGGGTPSLLPPELLSSYLGKIHNITGNLKEFTIEANPESLTVDTLDVLSESPVDRISMGVQTYNESLLEWLGRPAGRDAVEMADRNLSKIWKGRLSRDLLAALPIKQRNLTDDLNAALSDNPGHLSLYELTIESGTPLATDREAQARLPDNEDSLAEWEKALDYLNDTGYSRYEISNFCSVGQECLHNIRYWKMKPYLGIGPGAASTIPSSDGRAVRREIPGDIGGWLADPGNTEKNTPIDRDDFITEHFMMGLRTSEGLSRTNFESVFGRDPLMLIPRTIDKWYPGGFLQVSSENLSLDSRGMDLLDSILVDIIGELETPKHLGAYNWPALTVNKTA